MTYALQDRLDRLGVRMQEVAGEAVTYYRGANTASLTAVPIHLAPDTLTEAGLNLDADVRLWGIDTADLVISGSATLPQIGDYFLQANGSKWEVLPITDDQPAYRYTTSSKGRLLVATKCIETA